MPDTASEPMLTRAALADRVLAEQVALMCRLTTSPLFASTYLGAMFWWLMLEDYGATASSRWYAAMLLVTFVRWRVGRGYLAQPNHEHDVRRWRVIMLALAALAGALVGARLLHAADRSRKGDRRHYPFHRRARRQASAR